MSPVVLLHQDHVAAGMTRPGLPAAPEAPRDVAIDASGARGICKPLEPAHQRLAGPGDEDGAFSVRLSMG
jgi:hypothetical protein